MKNLLKTLAPTLALPHGRGRAGAFTLAEVLITLGVIGVVAALTLPTLISNHNKKVWAKGLAKAYSATSQACRMALAQDGVDSFWDTETGQMMSSHVAYRYYANDYLVKYYKNAETINLSRLAAQHNPIKSSHGSWITFYGGNHLERGISFPSYTIFPVFTIGATDTYHGIPVAMYYVVDANGYKKQPNVIGKDIYMFGLNGDCSIYTGNTSSWGVLSHSHHSGSFSEVSSIADCIQGNQDVFGISDRCFAKVMKDGWEIKY